MLTTLAKSVPSIFGIDRALATSFSASVSKVEITPRITPWSRRWRTSARVSISAEHRNLELLQIFFGNLLRAPVGADSRKLAHDQPFDIGARGFVVFGLVP